MVVVKNLWFWGRQALRSRRGKVLSLESWHICTTLAVRAAWGAPMGAGQLDGGQLPVHLQILSHQGHSAVSIWQ